MRATRGDAALDAYMTALGADADQLSEDELVTDLIVDVLHAVAAAAPLDHPFSSGDAERILDLALLHFSAES